MRGPYNGKYRNLYEHLRTEEPESLLLTFQQIEKLIGSPLPPSARTHQAWWANQERGQGLAWDRAGFKTKALDLAKEHVTFLRFDQHDFDAPEQRDLSPLTIAEAKERIALALGINASQIEITIRA